MFGGVPQHLHVGVGKVRPPFRLRLGHRRHVAGRVPAGDRLPLPLLREPQREPDRRLDSRTAAGSGPSTWAAARRPSPAVNRLGRGSVFETFLNRQPCGRGTAQSTGTASSSPSRPGVGTSSAGSKSIGASETSPLIVGNRIYVGDYAGRVYCLRGGRRQDDVDLPGRRGRQGGDRLRPRPHLLRSLRRAPLRAEGEQRQADLARGVAAATGSAGTASSTRRLPSRTRASISARPTATSTRSASRAASCAGRTTRADSSTARRPCGAVASSSARTTTLLRLRRGDGSRPLEVPRRTARSRARRPSSTASSTSPPSSGARTGSTRSRVSRSGRIRTAPSLRS